MQVPSREVDKEKFWTHWNRDTKQFFLQFAFKLEKPGAPGQQMQGPPQPLMPSMRPMGGGHNMPPPPLPHSHMLPPPPRPSGPPPGMPPPPPMFNPVPPPPPSGMMIPPPPPQMA